MKCLVIKIGVALATFLFGVVVTSPGYSTMTGHSQLPRHDHSQNIESSEIKTPAAKSDGFCKNARQMASETMAADWYRAATHTVSGGNLNWRMVCKPSPVYPREAIDAKVAGMVTVSVIVNESGVVKSARAIRGHRLLRSAAQTAAREALSLPTKLGGEPVNVRGVITYDFVLP